ncbi:MAG: undecaprenyl-diphosphate phosphatase, partial [Candidatus Roizmanbacteria bacterium]|nr:undecaprenyl-diphosphate phosphatase [Candidatus Roizmanbacteria bacterium]
MNWLQALLLGVIEGVTEFLPISSTAHLLIAERLLQLPTSTFWSFFTVFIQLGAILSVIAAFFPYLKERRLLLLIGTGFLPTAFVGLTLYKLIKSYLFGNFTLMALMFIGVGLLFLVLEWLVYTKRLALSRKIEALTYQHALFLGFAQALAVVPGVSRSGIVFVAGMALGYRRADMALFSFLLAVP